MEPLLRVEHVTISYNGKDVVKDVSFTLNPGEILGVVGESGSGKSTIIKAIIGLLGGGGMVTGGDIWYKGRNVVDMPEKNRESFWVRRLVWYSRTAKPLCVPSVPLAYRFMRV